MGSHNDNAMDQRLLIPSKSQSHGGGDGGAGDDSVASCEFTWSVFVEEVKRLGYIAGPMVAINLSQYLLQVISLMMVGHLGELQLSSTAIAVSLSSVTGFSVILGTVRDVKCIGNSVWASIWSWSISDSWNLNLYCDLLPIVDKILVFVGQDPVISHEAGIFQMWLIPSLFAYGMAQPLVRYLQAQSLIIPMLITAVITLCFHVPVCWYLVFRTRLQNVGAALAMCLSNWLSFASLALYVMNSSSCAKTMVPISTDLFRGIGEFFRYAIPSAVMVCLEWWSFELLVLLSGLLPNPALETSVLSVCLTTIATFYSIPYGLGAAASTRVSNELGRGKPELARISVFSVMSIAVAEALVVSLSLYACRHAFGYSFSNEKEVIDYVTRMAPLICLSVIMDSLQGVLSGIARGCGWQHIGAYINLGAFYLCGIPVGIALGFWTDLRGKGLWIGVQVGAFTQTLLMFFVTFCTNWEKQARDARERILKGESTVTNPLI
ncbi:Protein DETOXIFICATION 12 [Linum perenne]